MRVNQLQGVKTTPKTFEYTDFNRVTDGFMNLKITKDGLFHTKKIQLKTLSPELQKIKKVMVAGDRVLFVNQSNEIFECLDDYARLVLTPEPDFEDCFAIKVNNKGEEKVLVHSSNGQNYLLCSDFGFDEFNLDFFSEVLAYSCGRVFFGVNRKIVFCETFDIKNQPPNVNKKFIELPSDAGAILSIIPKEKKLLILTEFAVFNLTPLGDEQDYLIERLFTFKRPLVKNTVKRIGESVYFISGANLFEYSKNGVKEITTLLNFNDYILNGEVAGAQNQYMIPVISDQGESGVYCINTDDYSEQYIRSNTEKVYDGGLFIGPDGVYEISEEKSDLFARWTSKFLDFGTIDKKAVKKIYFESDEEVTLTLVGEYFKKSFNSKGGAFTANTNLTFNKLRVIVCGEKAFSFRNLKIIYTKKGE